MCLEEIAHPMFERGHVNGLGIFLIIFFCKLHFLSEIVYIVLTTS